MKYENTKLYQLIPKDCAIYYKNLNDLVRKIKYYKNNQFEMKKIANNGKKFYNKNFNSTIVSQFILDRTFNFKNKFSYSWDLNNYII